MGSPEVSGGDPLRGLLPGSIRVISGAQNEDRKTVGQEMS